MKGRSGTYAIMRTGAVYPSSIKSAQQRHRAFQWERNYQSICSLGTLKWNNQVTHHRFKFNTKTTRASFFKKTTNASLVAKDPSTYIWGIFYYRSDQTKRDQGGILSHWRDDSRFFDPAVVREHIQEVQEHDTWHCWRGYWNIQAELQASPDHIWSSRQLRHILACRSALGTEG